MSRAALPDLAKEALAGPAAKLAVKTADAYYGYGDYAQAAELYRAALTKTGADVNLINLHLGMALARAGDKAGATAALNAVTGPRAELAKYWLVYLATRN
jgi:predicted Zn-dependent protease